MSDRNKATLEKANAAITRGDIEGFLAFCADDLEWTTVGERPIVGRAMVRQWMTTNYREPPRFDVTALIAEGDFVVALGTIATLDSEGESTNNAYCDVWRFRDGVMVELKAFVIAAAPIMHPT